MRHFSPLAGNEPAAIRPEVGLLAPSLGGFDAGFDHLGAAAGAKRGLVAGSIFGGAILVAHQIHGAEAKADLPDPAILLIVITTVLAVGFGALGNWLRERATRRVG